MAAGTRSRGKIGLIRAGQETKTKDRKCHVSNQIVACDLKEHAVFPSPLSFHLSTFPPSQTQSEPRGRNAGSKRERNKAHTVAIAATTKKRQDKHTEKANERKRIERKSQRQQARDKNRAHTMVQESSWKRSKGTEGQRRGDTKAVQDKRVHAMCGLVGYTYLC